MRNPAIELWRCFCMFAIVLGHVLVYNGLAPRSLFLWHIPGFLVISGFFGIKFSIQKFFKLLLIVWSCYWMTIPFRGGETLVSLMLPHGGWFFPFYVMMMLTSVIWNAATARRENDVGIVSVIAVLLLFETISLICPRMCMLSTVTGNNEWGFLLMISTYLLARIISQRRIVEKINGWVCALLFIGGIACSAVLGALFDPLITFTQPISILTGLFGFLAFGNIRKMPDCISKVVCFIAPSMFSVYLIHEVCVRRYSYAECQAPTLMWGLGRTCLIFAACVALDLCRRFVFFAIKKTCQCLMDVRMHGTRGGACG